MGLPQPGRTQKQTGFLPETSQSMSGRFGFGQGLHVLSPHPVFLSPRDSTLHGSPSNRGPDPGKTRAGSPRSSPWCGTVHVSTREQHGDRAHWAEEVDPAMGRRASCMWGRVCIHGCEPKGRHGEGLWPGTWAPHSSLLTARPRAIPSEVQGQSVCWSPWREVLLVSSPLLQPVNI